MSEAESPSSGPAARRQRIDVGPSVVPRAVPGRLRIELLTDPWSVWCWGFEPVRRTLELRYPSLEFRFLLGGMFPQMPSPEEVGFDVERFFAIVQRTTGMPIRGDGVRRDPPDSTFPACINVHAARQVAPEREPAFLRAMREAAYLDGRNIGRADVGADIAAAVGIDPEAFRGALESGDARRAFEKQLEDVHAQNLHAYPTLLFQVDGRTSAVQGFQSLPAVLGIAQSITGRIHAPLPDPPLESIVAPGERVATREVAEVLGTSVEEAYERLQRAESANVVVREAHSTGTVWSRPGAPRPLAKARAAAPKIQPAP